MGIKFSSVILLILGIFIAKISFENINLAQAGQPEPTQRVPSSARISK